MFALWNHLDGCESTMRYTKLALCFQVLCISTTIAAPISNCPMNQIRSVIERAASLYPDDAAARMQIIRRIMEDIYGGKWGVIIIIDTRLVSSEVHWTIPDLRNADDIPAFCLHVYDDVQYNVFKSSHVDSLKRVSVGDFLANTKSKGGKQIPEKMTVEEFEKINSQKPRFSP